MEIPLNINEKNKKCYYSQLYNQAIKNNNLKNLDSYINKHF